MRNNRQGGFTLIEIMVVLVLGIIIVAVAAGGVGRAFSSNDATTEVRNIHDLMTNIQSLKGTDGYSSVSTQLLYRVDGLPTPLTTTDGTSVLNSWDGAVTVNGSATAFTVNYAGVPAASCIQIATKIAEAGVMNVHVGSTAVTTSAQANTGCAADTNTMSFTYNATSPVT